MTTLPVLETERLRIRPFTSNDLDQVHQLYTVIGWVDEVQTPDEQLAVRRRYVQWSSLNHQALADLHQPPTGDRIVELKATGQFVGVCGNASLWLPMGQLPSFGGQTNSHMQPEVALMWAVLPESWGNGYAPEMGRALIDALFTQFNLRRIVATTEYNNTASQRVMEKLGMRLERNLFPGPFWFQVVGIVENPAS
ncbi:MAG: GNAT family N-acetyltransferase [Ardenticatenaceae bacterium]|nr:GNAT family N-acetyltransferase [Ardenticatenaceae bacterium]